MSPSKLVEERSSFQYSKYSIEYEDRFFQITGPSRSLSLENKACKTEWFDDYCFYQPWVRPCFNDQTSTFSRIGKARKLCLHMHSNSNIEEIKSQLLY
jgi:hypothetical protein